MLLIKIYIPPQFDCTQETAYSLVSCVLFGHRRQIHHDGVLCFPNDTCPLITIYINLGGHGHRGGGLSKSHIGEIDETRYESYLAFVEEAKEYKEKVKYQGVKTETSHKQTHDKVAVKISSRKRQSARNTLKQNIYKDIDNE